MEGTCQPGMCHLTLTSFSWSTAFLTLRQVLVIRFVSVLPYNLDRLSIFGPCFEITYDLFKRSKF